MFKQPKHFEEEMAYPQVKVLKGSGKDYIQLAEIICKRVEEGLGSSITCNVAGGCVRDILYDVQPKDFDIIVTGFTDEAEAFLAASTFHSQDSDSLAVIQQAYDKADDMSDFDARYFLCMKVEVCGCKVDLLFSRYDTVEELVHTFDCNMNMVYILGGHIIGGRVSKLKFRQGIEPSRIAYMTDKFEQLSKL